MKNIFRRGVGAIALLLLGALLLWFFNTRDESDAAADGAPTTTAADAVTIERGAYLARAGNCMTCHTARGGAPYAGGLGIATPFGTVFTSNLTPDAQTGLGTWSANHFWRALHNGRSKSGRLLYPAFPYTNYTLVTRSDSDALLAYLKSLPAVSQTNRPHALHFPFDSQAALAVWRAIYFTPGVYQQAPGRNAEWNRGAYLVDGLGHCNACHSARNALGASKGFDLSGGLIPVQNWYAPSLVSPQEAGVGQWSTAEISGLLKTGVTTRASVSGPMAEVVKGSTQYLGDADLAAMALFLKDLPTTFPSSAGKPGEPGIALMSPDASPAVAGNSAAFAAQGAKLYEQHCSQCHGDTGRGVANAYPALAGNRAVLMPQTVNLVQIVLNGGFAPSTQGNPRPFGMPPFVLVLQDSEIAAVLTHIRSAWGNAAGAVSALDVNRIRSASGS